MSILSAASAPTDHSPIWPSLRKPSAARRVTPWFASRPAKSGKLARQMMPKPGAAVVLLVFTPLLLVLFLLPPTAAAKWKYFRTGKAADSTAIPRPGIALMGGGEQD